MAFVLVWGVPVVNLNLVNCGGHSCRLAWETVQGYVLLRGVDAFAVAFFDDLENLVVAGMFRL